MTRILLLPGCDPQAFRAARADIGSGTPELLRGASTIATDLDRKDQLRLDWTGVQIQYSGMGSSVAPGYEPIRIRAEILRILETAIVSAERFEESDPLIEDMGRMSRLALVVHPDATDITGGQTTAVSATPLSAGFCYARHTTGRSLVTADETAMRRWMPDAPDCVVIRNAFHDDGISRIVMEPLAGFLPVEAVDPVERLRLHSRFGS